jgi:predicted AlkP superfamily pyrophosphatase or phosphodiesterase
MYSDGGKSAVIAQSDMPVLKQVAGEGACTWGASTIYPSVTLPSHTSMLTGVGPEKHRVLWNSWKPRKGVVGVPTIFAEAKRGRVFHGHVRGQREVPSPGAAGYGG